MSSDEILQRATLDKAALKRILQVGREFAAAWQKDQPLRIEECLGDVEGAVRSELLRDLLRIELDYRRRHGESPEASDYHTRFPHETVVIAAVFESVDQSARLAQHVQLLDSISRLGLARDGELETVRQELADIGTITDELNGDRST